MAKPLKSARKPARTRAPAKVRVYTLDVVLLTGPVTGVFARNNPVVSRTIEVRGDQTLADLHDAIFQAFDRQEAHSYEFQFGRGPMDPEGPRYVLPGAYQVSVDDGKPAAGLVTDTTINALRLGPGR